MTDENQSSILAEYFDPPECATELGISALTLSRWRMQKKGPPVTYMGRTILYKKSSVKAWLAAQERQIERLDVAATKRSKRAQSAASPAGAA
jgi:hypothetical protein